MNTFAAVMTGKGMGAISTIQVIGDSAQAVVKKIFTPAAAEPVKLKTGKILLGTITDDNQTIDQVTIGCEQPDSMTISCHGNPLIVSEIMQLLGRHGVTLLSTEQLMAKITSANTISVEAKLAQAKAKTIEGTKIILNQIEAGLSKKAQNWLENINDLSLEKIRAEATEILQRSETAKLIIYGCTAVLTGPPNTGKSTLLNYLAGKQKAIVTDVKGTTRDWVTAQYRTESLFLELIDTAGLSEELQNFEDTIEATAQKKSIEILEQTDLILFVLDSSQTNNQLDERIVERIADKKVITVLNKCDLTAKFDSDKLPEILSSTVQISAKGGTGIENLLEKIRQITGVANFDSKSTVCFTERQKNLLEQLINAESKQQASSVITELLNGQLRV
ncbi:MAG: GTP-binding protein [Phycisphaerales bacterium]|jgi:tRNA modification GTPase